jgi:hypothetical protein
MSEFFPSCGKDSEPFHVVVDVIQRRLFKMRSFFEASLVMAISVVATVMIMVVIFPRHERGGKVALEASKIAPTVLIYGIHDRPRTGGSLLVPSPSDESGMVACPYLALPSAAATCFVTPRRNEEAVCPFLLEQHPRHDEVKSRRDRPHRIHI